ncbi:MAG: hypothetical protein V1822_02130 [Candidatus Micrarchaeota archaeon]
MVDIPTYCRSLDSAFTQTSFENALGGDWLALVFLGLLGMVFLLSLIYMAAQIFRFPKMEAWARFELFQVLATAVIAIMVAGSLYWMCHFDVTFMYGPNGGASQKLIEESKADCGMAGADEFTPYCAAQGFLGKLETRGRDMAQILIAINYVLSYMFSVIWNSSPMGIGFAVEPLAGFNQIMNVFLVAVSGFVLSYLTVLVQMRVLDYFLIAIPFYFLPLGLLLRTFAPTREFGGAVVGFSVASLFFYPMLLVLNDAAIFAPFDAFVNNSGVLANSFYSGDESAYAKYTGSMADVSQSIMGNGIQPLEGGQQMDENFGIYDGVDRSGLPVEDGGGRDISQVSKFFTEPDPDTQNSIIGGRTWELSETIFWPYQLIFVYSIAAVVLPIINFVVYIEIARELTHLFGVQMDLTNLTRLI